MTQNNRWRTYCIYTHTHIHTCMKSVWKIYTYWNVVQVSIKLQIHMESFKDEINFEAWVGNKVPNTWRPEGEKSWAEVSDLCMDHWYKYKIHFVDQLGSLEGWRVALCLQKCFHVPHTRVVQLHNTEVLSNPSGTHRSGGGVFYKDIFVSIIPIQMSAKQWSELCSTGIRNIHIRLKNQSLKFN
jgi:hypothetical protein